MSAVENLRRPVVGLPTGVVSFLLTDVVGSTRLWENEPDLMPTSLERHDHLVQQAVERHGGVLLKAKGEGDSTFSVFARATDAIAAACDAQTALQTEAWPEQTLIRVRMAVHTGEAIEREGDYFGRTVNRAARLRAIADADQVLVSQAAAELVVDHLPPRCELLGLGIQQLKDLSRPEVVFALVAEDWRTWSSEPIGAQGTAAMADTAPLPMPQRMLSSTRSTFTGRARDLQRLQTMLDASATGARNVALLSGEPGIGKTRLSLTASAEAHAKGAAVLLGRCDEDFSVPYQPWIEALGHLVTHVPAAALHRLGPRKLADLAGLVREVADRHPVLPARPPTDPETERYLLFAAVVSLIEVTSEFQPLVLVLDDLHWADKPSLLLLRHLLQSSNAMRITVIATFRDSEVSASPQLGELLAALHRETNVERFPLVGLEEPDIIELLEAAAGEQLAGEGAALARVLRRDTDGNPFYLGEMLRHLSESGQLVRHDDDRWAAAVDARALGLPESVRAVVGQRVVRLGAIAQQVLRIAAVIGREFDFELLGAVAGQSDDDVVEVLELARGSALLQEVSGAAGRYGFAHALVQQTLYDDLSSTRRQMAHRQIAETLEALAADGAVVQIAELAQHWMLGGRAADLPKMVAAARAAGDAAVSALAPDEAARWYASALELHDRIAVPDPSLRVQILIALGSTQLGGGELRLHEAGRIALEGGDDDGLIDAMLADTRGWRSRVREVDTERLALVEAALAAVGLHDSVRRARLLKGYATDLAYAGQSGRCWQIHDEAVQMGRRIGEPDTLLHVLTRRLAGFWAPDSLSYRLDASREAVELAELVGDPAAGFWACTDLALASGEAALGAETVRAIERRDRYAAELAGQPGLDWVIGAVVGTKQLLEGRFDDAERSARDTFTKATNAGSRHAVALLGVQLSALRQQQGRDDDPEVYELHRAVIDRAPQLDCNRALLVRALISSGDLSTAHTMMEAEHASGVPIPWDVYWLMANCYWADITVRLGHRPTAQLLYERLLPWERHVAIVSSTTDSATALYLGMLATLLDERAAAEAHFEAARSLHERGGGRYSLARTELEWARLLANSTSLEDRSRAVGHAGAAHRVAGEWGFEGVRRQAELLLG